MQRECLRAKLLKCVEQNNHEQPLIARSTINQASGQAELNTADLSGNPFQGWEICPHRPNGVSRFSTCWELGARSALLHVCIDVD